MDSKRIRQVRKTNFESFDMAVLEKRITVSDRELAYMLGVGVVTARRIAEDAGAVCRIGTRRVNKVDRVRRHLDALAGEK